MPIADLVRATQLATRDFTAVSSTYYKSMSRLKTYKRTLLDRLKAECGAEGLVVGQVRYRVEPDGRGYSLARALVEKKRGAR